MLEDVYVTGLAAEVGGIGHKNIQSLTNSNGNKIDINWCSGARIFQVRFTFNNHFVIL